ncbi:hypothetical protein GCM10023191_007800 [Actinoallomurus oryzae]|uniref:Uncharacterized protein n=1 Tax=Actinoallomurus oryzae TaxID=502180 RepID=A0ABP8PCL1_9ACTN
MSDPYWSLFTLASCTLSARHEGRPAWVPATDSGPVSNSCTGLLPSRATPCWGCIGYEFGGPLADEVDEAAEPFLAAAGEQRPGEDGGQESDNDDEWDGQGGKKDEPAAY